MATSPQETLRTLNSKKERIFRRVQVTYELIKTLPNKKNIFLSRAEDVQGQFQEFDSVLCKIVELNELVEDRHKIEVEQSAAAFDDLYYEIKSAYKIYRDPAPESKPLEPVGQTNDDLFTHPKLPDLQITPFAGQYEQFPAFISLFDTLIHSRNYSDIVKFSYLRSLLIYPASQTIASIEFNSENYKEAYDKLISRYSNKRIVAAYHLNKIIQFKPFTSESASNFRAFLDTFEDNFNALKALQIDDLADFLMVHLALNVLDNNTRRVFEHQLKEHELPNFSDLSKFLKAQSRVAELCSEPVIKNRSPRPVTSKLPYTSVSRALLMSKSSNDSSVKTSTNHLECPLCRQRHKILSCPQFINADVSSRYEMLKKFRLCFSCSGPHAKSRCQSTKCCQTCGSKNHNTLLHQTKPHKPASLPEPENNEKSTASITAPERPLQAIVGHTSASSCAILGTAHCSIRSASGQWYSCRMVIDTGSQVNFITSSLVKKLNLEGTEHPLSVSGIGETSIPISKSQVRFFIAPKSGHPTFDVSARVTSTIVGHLPLCPVPSELHSRFSSLELADSSWHTPGEVDLLLGVQMYGEILSNPPQFIKGQPCAIHTIFGWILFGEIPSLLTNSSVTSLLSVDTLQEDLKRFWEIEEVSVPIPPDPEGAYCEDYFQNTISRDNQGRYIVSLPFRRDVPVELSHTRNQALTRLQKLELKFLKEPSYHLAYAAQMGEYISLDHVRETKTPSDYIMTHHGVVKDSSTTKLRVVFNGSEKISGGNSLNDLLCTGPQLQSDIGELIDSFRTYRVALTCDIKMMFRCIRLNEADRKYVHFLWRSDLSEPIVEYELTTLPFGLKCSPFIAQRVIIQLYHDEGHRFPRAQQCLKETYVDNVVSGAEDSHQAFQLYEELVGLHEAGGFSLRKFSSNSPELLSKIPEELQDQPFLDFDDSDSTLCVKVLGLKWNPKLDVLCYQINLHEPVLTKRGVLSIIARIFDINGYLSPVTFWAKHLIQCLWLRKLDWDEDLPNDLNHSWISFLNELPCLEEIQLPRYIWSPDVSSSQMIAFGDASERGYGCVVYLRTETTAGKVQIHLIRAKSRVAPLKTLSINRLELNAALLVAKVVESLSNLRKKLMIEAIYCFSDSKDVLFWLQTPPHQLKMYVATRVIQILSLTEPNCWNYIPSGANPADCLSRGLTPKNLLSHRLYWTGPDFLVSKPAFWPITQPEPPDEPLELKPIVLFSQEEPNPWSHYLNKYSSFLKLTRVVAFCLRYLRNLKNFVLTLREMTDRPDDIHTYKNQLLSGNQSIEPLTITELDTALITCVRLSQRDHYEAVFSDLERGQLLKGSLAKLSLFLSDEGTLRVGGRLKNAPISFSAKHPWLIHPNSHLAKLICDHYHTYSLHGGPQLVQSLIHRKFWIPSLRNLVRKRIFRCQICFKSKAKPKPPIMGDLPDFRVSATRAFARVGVDYGGPFLIKASSKRNSPRIKCWIALFVCPSTHAVHLESVTDLTTSSFIATLDRFISRRGLPSHIYSDCGTNFTGAAKKLKELFTFVKDHNNEIQSHLGQKGIQWNFLPPASPHMGGLWESAIKSTKRHLLAVLQDRAVTYEEFSTLLSRVEAVLNSRPICAVSNNPSDNLDYLSPGHFLIGQPLLARPEPDNSPVFPLNSRWEMISRLIQHFWRRWYHEYLHTLTPRSKWYVPAENLQEGQLVILHERDVPLQEWILARVIKPLPGPDGVVRVVRLKTSSSTLTRPVHKIVPLPCGDSF